MPDAAAALGWRYGAAIALGPEARMALLAASGSVLVADLLP